MGWECAFLYSLWNYIPGNWMWSLKSPRKVLEKWLQFLVWCLLCSFFCNLYRSTQSFTNCLFLIIYLQASWSNPLPKNWKRLRWVVETVVYVTILFPYNFGNCEGNSPQQQSANFQPVVYQRFVLFCYIFCRHLTYKSDFFLTWI